MPFDPMKPIPRKAQLCFKAADLIRKHGHVKEALGSPKDGFCLLGAMYWAEHESMGETSSIYGAVAPKVGWYIPAWNNAPERTQEEVIALLEDVGYELMTAEAEL